MDEVWAKVGTSVCLKCHKAGGDAEESKFILLDPQRAKVQDDALRHNRDAFARMARLKEKDQSRLLLKVVGELDHGGEDVLKPDSTGYRILAEFVRRVNAPTGEGGGDRRSEGAAVLRRRRDARRPPAAPPRHAVARRPAADRRRIRRRRRRTA